MSRLTNKNYWDASYSQRVELLPVNLQGFRNYCTREIFRVKEKLGLEHKRILEIGGGGSGRLLYLASRYPDSQFATIDYSEEGCGLLKQYVETNSLNNISVQCADFFEHPPPDDKFDLVYSHGVVEHFADLAAVLSAFMEFVDEDGRLITFIPNMSGILGTLTKKFNRHVYDIHVPHDERSFIKGHLEAGLEVLESGYLCSNNFGVLASCFEQKKGLSWNIYKQLTRVSKVIWAFESRFIDFPTSRLFSPYIYVVAKKR